ncbi:Regulating synaptic membrane exocytosis protein 2 [Portunus trituberculatus]|uniref:Regulating synaptic membrane exocytosis protein 2 n=1 Tax=Portunus trituberculatus TaxID=210409 RepID=A0A5B7IKK0_PORTR|nr:Regulating synaptic membrane exocytosis protein 2 [Portunus trituberculatus]
MGLAQIMLDDLDLSNIVIGWYKLFGTSSLVSLPTLTRRGSMASLDSFGEPLESSRPHQGIKHSLCLQQPQPNTTRPLSTRAERSTTFATCNVAIKQSVRLFHWVLSFLSVCGLDRTLTARAASLLCCVKLRGSKTSSTRRSADDGGRPDTFSGR